MEVEIPKKVMDKFEEMCKKYNITGDKKKGKLEQLKKMIKNDSYEPGEAIGIVAAQSISEPATQMTMRSYTLASQSDRLSKVTQGLPRLIEIFDARKNFEKNMKIYLEPKYNNKNGATKIANMIRKKEIKDIIKSHSIDLVNMRIELELIDINDRELVKKIISRYIKDCEISFRENKVLIKPKDDDIKNLRKILNKILEFHIKGIKDIEQVIVVKEKGDWVLQTRGANLEKILRMEGVDIKRTTTNDVYQVYEVLGIEAARNVILKEAKETLDEQGLDVDIRHLMLLADMMTSDGDVKAIGRYGVSGSKASILARANFEETKRHLMDAAFYGQSDDLDGIIENVMIGQVAPVGTGMVNLAVDLKKMQKMRKK